MGYAYNELVAPAILFKNPNITREEFVTLLEQTHISFHYSYSSEQEWDYHNPEYPERRYHDGLNGLARILRLSNTKKFCEFQETKQDENGLFIRAPYLIPAPSKADHKYEVIVHQGYSIGKAQIREGELSYERLKPGDVWQEPYIGDESGLVTSIINESFIGIQDEEDLEFWEKKSLIYEYDFVIKPIRGVWKRHKYKSEKRLYQFWPMFHPDNIFDWGASSGSFYLGPYFNTNTFRWKKNDERYFLDELTFDLIPASMNSTNRIELGYTDLILTAEAIKHNAWKLLSYKGRNFLQDFLRDFPESKAEYERAVWDSHTSLSAKLKRMNVSDFLRFRMLRD